MIRNFFTRTLTRLSSWLSPPSRSSSSSVSTPLGRTRNPTAGELLTELKSAAWTCATLNAAVCASYPPRLYVTTRSHQRKPRCLTRRISVPELHRLHQMPHVVRHLRTAEHVEEVREHPLLDLLAQVNPVHNAFDLWELTTLYQEVHGCAYWLLEPGMYGAPVAIWPLPTHLVVPYRESGSTNLVDSYLYHGATGVQRFSPEQIIAFRYPDLRDPYNSGLSPLRACIDQIRLSSAQTAFRLAKFENHAVPDAIVSPEDMIGDEERDRLERSWNEKLRRGGAGRVIVASSALRVHLLEHSMGDLAALADLQATHQDICNAFHVPIAYLTSHTNLANLQAAEQQHTSQAIRPRLHRRDEKLNEQLIPLFDPSGRLFLASDDPVPGNRELLLREREMYLRRGVITINELRSELGLPPVSWGDASKSSTS